MNSELTPLRGWPAVMRRGFLWKGGREGQKHGVFDHRATDLSLHQCTMSIRARAHVGLSRDRQHRSRWRRCTLGSTRSKLLVANNEGTTSVPLTPAWQSDGDNSRPYGPLAIAQVQCGPRFMFNDLGPSMDRGGLKYRNPRATQRSELQAPPGDSPAARSQSTMTLV